MNIFFLRKDPRQAAIDQCDKHAVKCHLSRHKCFAPRTDDGATRYPKN